MPKQCKYLDHQVCIRTDGQYRLCCVSMESDNKEKVSSTSIVEWHNSETVRDAREKLSNDIWPDACVKCKINEENNVPSMRQRPIKYGPGISHLDLRFGNSCNLNCSMCFPGSSSSLHHEHEKIKSLGLISPWGQTTYEIFNWYTDDLGEMFANLKDLREVYLTGGEPMMVKHLVGFLKKLDSSVEVRFNTNGTIYNPQVYQELQRFERVSICYSIDGLGEVNDYIRWGSHWKDVEHNVHHMAKLKNVNISIGPTVQILNALYYTDLVDWATKYGYSVYENLLLFPKHYHLENSDDIIKQSVPQFEHWYKNSQDLNERQKFIDNTKLLDSVRGCNIRDYLPEVADIYGFD